MKKNHNDSNRNHNKNHIEKEGMIMRKETMKRIGSWALVLAMAATLMGCAASGQEATDPSGTTGPTAAIATDPGKATQPSDVTTPAQGGKATEPASGGAQPSSSGNQGNQGGTGNHGGSSTPAPTQPQPTEPPEDKPGGNGGSGNGSSSSGSSGNGGSAAKPTTPPATQPPVTQPEPTDSPATQPKPTEPPATEPQPTECQHNWVYDFVPEEGHYNFYNICDCGYTFQTTDEYIAHTKNYSPAEALQNHGGYGEVADWIVDTPFSEWWECSKCGAVSTTMP